MASYKSTQAVVAVADSSCIDLTVAGSGSTLDPYIISANPIVDPSAQNILTCGAGGLLADETTTALSFNGGTNELTYVDEDGNATVIDLSALAIDINVASVTYSAVTGVLTITETDATVHTVDLGPAILTVADTSCIDLTLTGIGDDVSPWVLSAAPIISPDAGNILTCLANGLYAPATVVQVADTSCIDLTLAGAGTTASPWVISADPIIDPAPTNILACGPTGLVATETVTTQVDNGDGSFTYTNEAGVLSTLDIVQLHIDSGYLIAETPAGVSYPDTDLDGRVEIGVEDTNGVPYPFDAASGEWNVQQVFPLAANADPNGVYGDPGIDHGIAVDETGAVWYWNETAGAWQRSRERRDHLIEEGAFTPATDAYAAHIDSPLFTGVGVIEQIHVSAFDNGLDGTIVLEIAADNGGTVLGTATLTNTGAQMITMDVMGAPVSLGAGSHTFTYRNLGTGTATVGTYENVDIAVDFRH